MATRSGRKVKRSTTHLWYVKANGWAGRRAALPGGVSACAPCRCTLGAGSAVLLQTVPLGCPIQQLPQPNKLCERKDLEESEGWDESGVKSSPVWCDFTQGHSIDTISLFSSGWGRAERCQRRGLRPHRPQKCPRFLGGDPTEGCGQ